MHELFKDKAFIEAREEFNKKAHTQKGTCTSVGWFDGKKYINDTNYQCHIGLNYYKDKGYGAPIAIFSGFQKDHSKLKDNDSVKKEIGEFFFHWIKGHPVWGKSVLNETFQDVWDDGWVFSTDQGRNTLCSAVFATRWPTEFPMACKAFKSLVEAGAHPDVAFLSSTIMAEMDGGYIEKQVYSGHMPCSAGVPDDFVANFLKYKAQKEKETYKENPGYSGINKVFDHDGDKYSYGANFATTRIYQSIIEGIGESVEKWRPTSDIFYTKKMWEKQFINKGDNSFTISPSNIKSVAKCLNNLREEIISA